MKIIQTITIPELQSAIRLNIYCENEVGYFESRKSVKKAISRGEVLLNHQLVNGGTWLKKGDIISIIDLENKPPKSYNISIPVVYEDDYLAILNKPPGLTVSGNQFKTLYNTLSYNLKPSKQNNALAWPLPVHRLDNQTSGLIMIAKTKISRIELGRMFEKNLIKKTYFAIAMGRFEKKTKLKGLFDDDIKGKSALTHFKIISESRSLKNDWLTLVKLFPKTGRTHQLRIHLSKNGTPIFGDKLYSKSTIRQKGLFLSATELYFIHPITKEQLTISISIPQKFKKRLSIEDRRWQKYNT